MAFVFGIDEPLLQLISIELEHIQSFSPEAHKSNFHANQTFIIFEFSKTIIII